MRAQSAADAASPPPAFAPPNAAYAKMASTGGDKGKLSPTRTLIMAILGGAYIGLGCALMLSVGPNCAGLASSNPGLQRILSGVIGLPMGLLLILVTGSELFTGNTALMSAAVLEGKATVQQLAKNWAFSYVGNLLGCVAVAFALAHAGVFATSTAPSAVAVAKTSLPWMQSFIRGVFANWFVCLAIFMATASASLPGKVLGVFIPISAFVAIGLEHSVANMCLIPLGIFSGATSVTWRAFFLDNLLPVSLGNIAAGVVLFSMAQSYAWGRLKNSA